MDNTLYIKGKKCFVVFLLHIGDKFLLLHDSNTQELDTPIIPVTVEDLKEVCQYVSGEKASEVIATIDNSFDVRNNVLHASFALAAAKEAGKAFGLENYVKSGDYSVLKSEAWCMNYTLKRNDENKKILFFSFELNNLETHVMDEILTKHVMIEYRKLIQKPNPMTNVMETFYNGLKLSARATILVLLFCDFHYGSI
jgi:hypothetical protein